MWPWKYMLCSILWYLYYPNDGILWSYFKVLYILLCILYTHWKLMIIRLLHAFSNRSINKYVLNIDNLYLYYRSNAIMEYLLSLTPKSTSHKCTCFILALFKLYFKDWTTSSNDFKQSAFRFLDNKFRFRGSDIYIL